MNLSSEIIYYDPLFSHFTLILWMALITWFFLKGFLPGDIDVIWFQIDNIIIDFPNNDFNIFIYIFRIFKTIQNIFQLHQLCLLLPYNIFKTKILFLLLSEARLTFEMLKAGEGMKSFEILANYISVFSSIIILSLFPFLGYPKYIFFGWLL